MIPLTMISSAINVASAYFTMKKIEINILNEERVSLILTSFKEKGLPLLNPSDVCRLESLMTPWKLNNKMLKIKTECDASELIKDSEPMIGTNYMIFKKNNGIHVAYSTESSHQDVIESYYASFDQNIKQFPQFIDSLKAVGWVIQFTYIPFSKNRYTIITNT